MNSQVLGKEIIRLRKELSLTQKQLCEGICTQPTISMIEKGDIIPRIDILILISTKLNKSFSYFIDLLLINNYEYIYRFISDIEEFTLERKFDYVYKIVKNELENFSNNQDEWFNVFLYWQYYLSSYHLNKISLEQAILDIKTLYFNASSLILSKKFLGARILNTIAFLYALNKEYKEALFYFNKIDLYKSQEKSIRLTEDVYYLRILYNKTKTLYEMRNYEEAIISCKQGINKSVLLENMSEIGNFYYYLGQCYEKRGFEKREISEAYKKALFFFKILDRKLYYDILIKEKQQFLPSF